MAPQNKSLVKYQRFLLSTQEAPDKKFLVIDGLPRSGTNYVRELVRMKVVEKSIVGSAHLHYLDNYTIIDDYIHNANVVHIFPIRESLVDVVCSGIKLLLEAGDKQLTMNEATRHVLRKTEKTLDILESGLKNIYFVKLGDLATDQKRLDEILEMHGIAYAEADADLLARKMLLEDEATAEIVRNRVPASSEEKSRALGEIRLFISENGYEEKLMQSVDRYAALGDGQ